MQAGINSGENFPFFIRKKLIFPVALIACAITSEATIISTDTVISANDFSYESQNIVISNCTVTIDGPHAFETLRVVSGSTLTHSPATNGNVTAYSSVLDEALTLSGSNAVALANSNIVLASLLIKDLSHTVTYSNNVDYVLGASNGFTTVARTPVSSIPDGGTVLASYTYATVTTNGGLNITVAGDLQVDTGAFVKADGRGYDNAGPGRGGSAGSTTTASGGSYGGFGGASSSNGPVLLPYDSPFTPTSLGSSGGTGVGRTGGRGGGLVHIAVGGNALINGTISANGLDATNSRSGGGSGGSIWLTASTTSGNGTLIANGGTGEPIHGGGGGGGRISIQFGTNSFTGSMLAQGGNGWQRGGAGTVFIQTNGTVGQVTFDNGNVAGAGTLVQFTNAADLVVQGRAVALLGSAQTVASFVIRSNSSMSTIVSNVATLTLTVQSNATVEAGAAVVMDGCGFAANLGLGLGNTVFASVPNIPVSGGSGHGGLGGFGAANASGGSSYDYVMSPMSAGSGGRSSLPSTSSSGGGSIRITVAGLLRLDGRISANGMNGGGPGGGGASGGSIWLDVGTISGTGLMSVIGGNGGSPYGGGGGGGRLALTYGTNSFTGVLATHGGAGFVPGGAGTAYTKANLESVGTLVVDNSGLAGTNTPLDITGISLIVTNGGSVRVAFSSFTINSVTVAPNSSLVFPLAVTSMTVSSNLTVAAFGTVSSDGVSQSGNGPGQVSTTLGSGGGGNGGYGGRGAGAAGGNAGGSSASPNTPGSTGGGGSFSSSVLGGGAIAISVNGRTTLDGKITALGANAPTNNAGGGSGGSVWLTSNGFFSGSGGISVDGGNGISGGGGGGGGRIAVYFPSNNFTGLLSARGGTGYVSGGAGTIYLKQNSKNVGDLIADNGGVIAGTNTLLDLVPTANITVTNGANMKFLQPSIFVNSLTVQSNSFFTIVSSTITVTSNAIVAAGGKITLDGQNTQSGIGSGSSSSVGSGGGGHGGFGGSGAGIDLTGRGGNAYDSAIAPSSPGGNGGSILPPAPNGGGFLHLIVNGLLTLQGSLSANGISVSSNSAGGGAGGSLWLAVGGIAGNGSISADGASGNLPSGGGGGGGRVALTYQSNSFIGTFSAKGGNGFVSGGAGTIYLKANTSNVGTILCDNGNFRGTNTVVNGSGTFDLTLQNGAVGSSIGSPRDVFIRSNSVSTQSGALTIGRNMTIDPGGAINLDALFSSTSGSGIGYSGSSPRGGGGHGGYGALNPPNFGAATDSATAPLLSGNPGGNGSGGTGQPLGGFGGAPIHLTVPGILTVNGRISANGGNGGASSGGGAGGSIWLDVGTLSGTGQISATGGIGDGTAGGGGGGRIAITFASNIFAGPITACGGPGAVAGGAGTIYLKNNFQNAGTLLISNCGLVGTNTPVSAVFGTAPNLQVSSGGIAELQSGVPAFSNITVTTGSALTSKPTDMGLFVGVAGDVFVDSTSSINADSKGSSSGIGAGSGNSVSGKGSGAGFGGAGGASASGAIGGTNNGSFAQPFSFGSGGGLGSGPTFGNSGQGGGLVRFSVGGTLDLDGRISAAGNLGLQDDSGGGSGGSIWLTAAKFTGGGSLGADGGDGDLYGGGGGGGGRIAIYSPANTFTGLVSVAAGDGAVGGQTGTVFTASTLLPFGGIGSTPTNSVSNVVSSIDVTFTDAVNPSSVTSSALKLFSPVGLLDQSNVTVFLPSLNTVRFIFSLQNSVGNYRAEVGPSITDLLGTPMSQVYTGYFAITLPAISGQIIDTNGQPVSGVLLQPTGGYPGITSDGAGNYSLGVPIGWTGTVTPLANNAMFIPSARNYTNVVANITNENYTEVPTIAATMQIIQNGTNAAFTWRAYTGVNYQIYSSSNLVNWAPVGGTIPGTNGIIQFAFPLNQPQQFFRITSQD